MYIEAFDIYAPSAKVSPWLSGLIGHKGCWLSIANSFDRIGITVSMVNERSVHWTKCTSMGIFR